MKSVVELSNKRFSHSRLNPIILNSWARCLRDGLVPDASPPANLIDINTATTIRDSDRALLKIVETELEELCQQISGSSYMVAFASSSGVLLTQKADSTFLNCDKFKDLRPGTMWQETARGTNALGLALVERTPVGVCGKEHFFEEDANISCYAAPIFSWDNNIVGALDVSTLATNHYSQYSSLVKLAARQIENKLFLDEFAQKNIIAIHPRHEFLNTSAAGLIALDEKLNIIGISRQARNFLPENSISLTTNILEYSGCNFINEINSHSSVRLPYKNFGIIQLKIIRNHLVIQHLDLHKQRGRILESNEQTFVSRDAVHKLCIEMINEVIAENRAGIICGLTNSGRKTAIEYCAKKQGRGLHLIDLNRSWEIPPPSTVILVMGADAAIKSINDVEQLQHKLQLHQHPLFVIKEGALIHPSPDRKSGAIITFPDIQYRSDFHLLCNAIVQDIYPDMLITLDAIRCLEGLYLPNQIADLKSLFDSALDEVNVSKQITSDILKTCYTKLSHDWIIPCNNCRGARSPLKEQQCITIQSLYEKTGGNVSIVARYLNISRTTVYAHLPNGS